LCSSEIDEEETMKKLFLFAMLLLLTAMLPRDARAQSAPPCPASKTCSGGVTFTVTFPNPTSPASVAPAQVVAGAAATTITLTAAGGSSFNAQMAVEACQVTPTPCTAQTDLATTFVDATHLTAVIPPALLSNSGTLSIYISQPSNAHASILNWGAPASDASHSAAVAYNVYRSGTSGGPLTDPTGRSMPLSLPA
jgi:hypothetical protein